MPRPGGSERTFRFSSQAATCPSVYPVEASHCPFNAERQAGKLEVPIFMVFGLTLLEIEPMSNVSVVDAPSVFGIRYVSFVNFFKIQIIELIIKSLE